MNTGSLPLSPQAPDTTERTIDGRAPWIISADRPPETTIESGQFQIWTEHFERRTGVIIHGHREPFVRRELARRLNELQLDFETYLSYLLDPALGQGEWRHLLDHLLIKETRFFRHRASHTFVQQEVARLAGEAHRDRIAIWSLGCSTGEEAYSLATDAMAGFATGGRPPNFAVIGTDISRTALREARAGIYPAHALNPADRSRLAPFLASSGTGRFQWNQEIRRRVAFVADNLLDMQIGFFPDGVDIIFCQHLLVYFRRWRRRRALNFLARRLRPGGVLIVGPGEGSDWQSATLSRVRHRDVCAYRRPGAEGQ